MPPRIPGAGLRFGKSRNYSTASTSPPIARAARPRKWPLRLAVAGGIIGGGYAYDRNFNASAISRSLRTAYIGILCTLDCEYSWFLSGQISGS